jgi:hypothetical protein
MSVLRFRQLSTRRFYVPRNELDEGRDVGEGREPSARPLELTPGAGRLPRPSSVPRSRMVVTPADELFMLVGLAENSGEPARCDEVLASLDRAFGVPERGSYPVLARWPLVVHGRRY